MKKKITVMLKMITVIMSDIGDVLSANHRNQFIKKTKGQSIVEYSILFATIVAVMIAAISLPNSPIRTSLNGTFRDLIDTIGTSVNGLIP
ncbi:Flp family type IVb pilin [Candidatus Omnitrophota bacterium]